MNDLLDGVLARETRAVARTLRVVDDRRPGYSDVLKRLWPHTGGAWVLGVTGNPGAGKSTLCDRLIEAYRQRGQRVGVIAVDPSSPFSGGAILGDRVRMSRHALDDGVFIRSLATRGHLGGLSRSTRDLVRVLDAAGYEVVMVETVGVGQDELDVTRTAHSTLVVMAPGLGDEVQAAKAGLLECADVFAVNKADREGADVTVGDLELMIALGHEGGRISSPRRPPAARSGAMTELAQARLTPTTESTDAGGKRTLGAAAEPVVAEGDGPPWTPPILKCVALRGEGVSAVVSALDGHARWSRETSAGRRRRRERLTDEVRDGLREALMEAAVEDLGARIDEAARDVESMVTDPYTATERLVAAFRSRSNPDQSTTPPLRGSLR